MAKVATRVAYGDALKELMVENKNVVVLDADLAGSTKSGEAKKVDPSRHFDMGIAEGNMMSVAAGLAASGKIAYASTFAMFATGRGFEQIRNSIGYPQLNVKICASHAGISVGEDGASHQCIEDVSLMRGIPGMKVIVPCDYNEAKQACKAVAEIDGPCYVRLGRSGVESVNGDDYKFELGKGVVLQKGEKVALVATGLMVQEALEAANELGYPVLVRPSYVLGGQGMQIAISDKDIIEFMDIINRHTQEHPILVDKYIMGKEVEVDAVCDGDDILIPGIMEHVERAGIHSGDSISVYPAQTLSPKTKRVIADYTKKLANSLHVIGLINIQFIAYNDEVYVIEVNPRSSRTVPYISKVTGIPIVDLATRVITGEKIKDMGYTPGLQPESEYFAIKKPVFSFEKIRGAEISLGPEMKSTGECLGISKNYNEALYKAFLGAGINLPKTKKMILTVKDSDKMDAINIGKRFAALGYEIYSTRSTCRVLNENGVPAKLINKVEEPSPNLLDLILSHEIDLIIDTPSQGVERSKDGFIIRRHAVETGVTCLTSLDTADALLTSLETADTTKLSLVDISEI